ncbi:hypothetical protein XENTR_v10018490 [Xenopus tropicalis]|nr:hypothetical protein XENTR_v10018490 [Xenopus tropicalis]
MPLIHRDSVTGVAGILHSDRNVGKDSSLPPSVRSKGRQSLVSNIPGGKRHSDGHSSSQLHSPHQQDPEIEQRRLSGDDSTRQSGECFSDVHFFLMMSPQNLPNNHLRQQPHIS